MQTEPMIRTARPSDLTNICNLLRHSTEVNSERPPDPCTLKSNLKQIISNAREGCVMVAENRKEIIGMCVAQSRISPAAGGKVVWVEDLVVHHHFCGMGLGKRLLYSVEDWASIHHIKQMRILADQDNMPVLHYYGKLGWRQTQQVCLQKKFQTK